MAKDDFHVLAYRLLAYLYACLKSGEPPDLEYLQFNTCHFPIGEAYWNYLLENLFLEGFITGVVLVPIPGQLDKGVKIQPNIRITPSGIEYMKENSSMEKAKAFLTGLKEVVPGLLGLLNL